jgi:hypothetical protein
MAVVMGGCVGVGIIIIMQRSSKCSAQQEQQDIGTAVDRQLVPPIQVFSCGS